MIVGVSCIQMKEGMLNRSVRVAKETWMEKLCTIEEIELCMYLGLVRLDQMKKICVLHFQYLTLQKTVTFYSVLPLKHYFVNATLQFSYSISGNQRQPSTLYFPTTSIEHKPLKWSQSQRNETKKLMKSHTQVVGRPIKIY